MNNDNFLIEENDLELAREICKYIKQPEVRNRAVANALAASLASKYFTEVEVDTKSGVHNLASVLDDIEVSDVYVNGSYIDVRFYFEGGDLTVPKSMYDSGLIPVAYLFIKLEENLAGGLVTGFVLPSSIDVSNEKDGYYLLSEDDLCSFYDIQPLLITQDDVELPEDFSKQIFDYLDGTLSNKNDFYKLLLSSTEARELLADASNVKNIFNFVSFDNVSAPAVEDVVTDDVEVAQDELVSLDDNESFDLSLDSEPTELIGFADEESTDDLSPVIDDADEFEEISLEESDTLVSSEEESLDFGDDLIPQEEVNDLSEIQPIEDELSFEEDVQQIEEIQGSEETIVEDDLDLNEKTFEEEYSDSDYKFSTSVTPSLEVYEDDENGAESSDMEEVSEPEVVEVSENIDVEPSLEEVEDTVITEDDLEVVTEPEDVGKDSVVDENAEQIDTLFGDEKEEEESSYEVPANKSKSSGLFVILLLIALGGAGYYGYTKYSSGLTQTESVPEPQPVAVQEDTVKEASKGEAMPIETVENVKQPEITNEGNAVEIPSIEQNLGATVSISNLKINWEVPPSYVSTRSISRYFEKMGKVLQLNLKTDLMLVNKPILSNKIAVELDFDKNNQKFVTKRVVTSSGDASIDRLILQTITRVLDMNLKSNMSVFKTLTGKPVLVIHL